VANVAAEIKKQSPQAILIVVCNPLDAMVYVAAKVTGFPPRKVIGRPASSNTSRFRTFLADELGCSAQDITAMVLGGHGDTMVPLVRYSTMAASPSPTSSPNRASTRSSSGQPTAAPRSSPSSNRLRLLFPAASTVEMAESILLDRKRVLPCAAYLDGGVRRQGPRVGVPCVLGAQGVEKVVECKLNSSEKKAFGKSVEHVRSLLKTIDSKEGFMRTIPAKTVIEAVAKVCGDTCIEASPDLVAAFERAARPRSAKSASRPFPASSKTPKSPRAERLPICQDTGLASFFVEVGDEVRIEAAPSPKPSTQGMVKDTRTTSSASPPVTPSPEKTPATTPPPSSTSTSSTATGSPSTSWPRRRLREHGRGRPVETRPGLARHPRLRGRGLRKSRP